MEITEIKSKGTLLHPLDCNEQESEGIYKNISYKLNNGKFKRIRETFK